MTIEEIKAIIEKIQVIEIAGRFYVGVLGKGAIHYALDCGSSYNQGDLRSWL